MGSAALALLTLTVHPPLAQDGTDLTAISSEELRDMEVTSVGKKKQSLPDAAAAVYVISNEDIRRSGATSIPEALRITGIEALLRWNTPDLGNVSPAEFIPLAEETGLIVPIGEWVLREACMQAKTWLYSGVAFGRMAVNVSVRQFSQPGFPAQVKQVLRETKLPPDSLELEMTESLLMKQADNAVSTLDALKRSGVQLAIDGFGIGYSSLAYLQQFPIDRLKIDRAFVDNVDNDRDNAAIARAVIAMAKSLDMAVTAEGVETELELGFLKGRSCDEAQGFLVARPVPPEQVPVLVAKDADVVPQDV